MSNKNISPRAATNRQEGTAQEPKRHPKRAQANSNTPKRIPVTADSAAWHVEQLKNLYPSDYKALANKAIELSRRGVRLSIASLFEWARLELFKGREGSPVKLNNTLRPALARALMRDFPELTGKFETRKAVCDDYEGERVTPD